MSLLPGAAAAAATILQSYDSCSASFNASVNYRHITYTHGLLAILYIQTTDKRRSHEWASHTLINDALHCNTSSSVTVSTSDLQSKDRAFDSMTHRQWRRHLGPSVRGAASFVDAKFQNRFSKFFHSRNPETICNKTITIDPTTPQVRRYTTLWNVRRCTQTGNSTDQLRDQRWSSLAWGHQSVRT